MPKWGGSAASGQFGEPMLTYNRVTNQWNPLTSDASGRVDIVDGGFMTAFGEKAVASKTPERQYAFSGDFDPSEWSQTHVSTGTSYNADSQFTVSTGTNAAGAATVLSKELAHYRPGQGIIVQFSAAFTTGVANSEQYIGLGDANNGFFFGYNGTSFGILHKNSGSNSWTTQSNWTENDKLNGGGASGITLTPSYPNVYMIQAQLHYMGKIAFYIVTSTSRYPQLVHTINWPNVDHSGQNTTIDYGNLPIQVHALNSGNTSNVTLSTASASVFIEGNLRNLGGENALAITRINAVTTEDLVFQLRNKTTLYSGNTNHTDVIINSISVSTDNNNNLSIIRARMDTNYDNAATWADVDAVRSTCEYNMTTASTVDAVVSGTATANSTATVISIPNSITNYNQADYFNGRYVVITGGTGAGQSRQILDHVSNGGNDEGDLTVARWVTAPDNTSTFVITNGAVVKTMTVSNNTSQTIQFTLDNALHVPPGRTVSFTLETADTTSSVCVGINWDEIK